MSLTPNVVCIHFFYTSYKTVFLAYGFPLSSVTDSEPEPSPVSRPPSPLLVTLELLGRAFLVSFIPWLYNHALVSWIVGMLIHACVLETLPWFIL